jgi:hypothetical protein
VFSAYYGQDALLMDEERSSMLPMMAAGKIFFQTKKSVIFVHSTILKFSQ